MKNSFFITLRWPLSRIPALRGTRASCPSRYRDVPPFFKHATCLKNEAKQKPRFLLCVLKKATDGLFQQPASVVQFCAALAAVRPGTRRSALISQSRMRSASPYFESLPQESSSTMVTGRLAIVVCMSRQLPASAV